MDEHSTVAAPVRRPRFRVSYRAVNAVGLPWDRLTDHEAVAGARKLYRIGARLLERKISPHERVMLRGLKARHGRVRSRMWRGYVNPRHGWASLVHHVSHAVERKHSLRHAWLEQKLAEVVVTQGWTTGALKKYVVEKPKPDIKAIRYQRTLAKITRWERRAKIAKTRLKTLHRQRTYYKKTLNV